MYGIGMYSGLDIHGNDEQDHLALVRELELRGYSPEQIRENFFDLLIAHCAELKGGSCPHIAEWEGANCADQRERS